jgi:hypothetical protein
VGATQATVRVEWTWGVINANGTEGPSLAGTPPPFKPNPGAGGWTGAHIQGVAGQQYWVKAVLVWQDASGTHTNPPVRGLVTLDP